VAGLKQKRPDVTPAYKTTLFALTGTVNSGAFEGFAAGEVLFLGASGSKRGEEDWEITYRFAASPNATDIQVGHIVVAAKKGVGIHVGAVLRAYRNL